MAGRSLSFMLRQRLSWTLDKAWSGSCVCRCDAPCRAVWPPGRHESSVQSCSACRWTHNPADNSVQTIPADNSADKSVRWSDVRTTHFSDQMYIQFFVPFSSYTLFRVVNFRCADMRLLFFQFITIKAVFKCNIQTTVSLPCVSLQSVSAGSVFCKFSVRECSYELSFELSAVVK